MKKIVPLILLFISIQSIAQERQFSSVSVSGYQPSTGHHLNSKTIEFSYDLYDFPVSTFGISANITSDDTPGFYIDGELYRPEDYPSWSHYLGSCARTTYKMSGYLVVNNGTRFPFSNIDVMAAHTQTPTGQIRFPEEIEIESVRFENVRIVGVKDIQVKQDAEVFLRWLKAQEEDEQESNNSSNSNGDNSNSYDSGNTNNSSGDSSYSNSNTSSNQKSYEQLQNEWNTTQKANRKLAEGDVQGAVREYKEAGMETDAAAVAMAGALSQVELGEFKASYGTLRGGLSLSHSEELAEAYNNYWASISMQGKGKVLAMEVGAIYTNNAYYEALGFVFGAGFGIGNDNTGVIFLGGVDMYLVGISDSEDYLDENGESGLIYSYGWPYNISGTFYHGVANGIGFTVGVKHYLGDALLGSSDSEDSSPLPNPYPSTHVSVGLAF